MKREQQLKYLLAIFLLVSIFFIYKLFFQDNLNYQPLVNKKSSCISCHTSMQGFAPAHLPTKILCVSCHLGNNTGFNKQSAHLNMVTVPGNLSNASKTCAKCHVGIDLRVKNSIMNTMSGIISVDKYVFNENSNLDSIFNIHHLKNESFADKHLRNKCASCHIGNEKTHANPITEKSRGGGCTACHLNYSIKGKIEHKKYIASEKQQLPNTHPSLSLKITDNHCFGCHSRSGRISTNYEGWHETTLKENEITDFKNYRVLEDKRVFEKQNPDIHHTKGLSCIDCHDSNDVMGNGKTYAHQENATNVNCIDCHFSSKAKTKLFTALATDEQRIVRLKKMDTLSNFVYSETSNKILLNVINEYNDNYLLTKNSNNKILLSKPSENCTKDAHKNLSCSSCHTDWSPQCISCHTKFDKNEDGFDLKDKKWIMGNFIEKGSDYLAEFPTLGVITKNSKKTIKTFSPGMVMHLKTENKTDFHRLFAPVSAHTIAEKGKKCIDCHNNPVALGYGRGKLTFKNKTWYFNPKYNLEKDGLPKDAWIPFLKEPNFAKATRKNARPFTLLEQQKILTVGSCLTCHNEKSKVATLMLNNYTKAFKNKNKECLLPKY